MIHYECRVHGRVDHIVTIRHQACCYICHDTVLLRYKWSPPEPQRKPSRVTRTPGQDQTRPVEHHYL